MSQTVDDSIAKDATDFDFDVCLSFAGEDRAYVDKVAELLRQRGIRTFYDSYQQASLWGQDLYTHLDYIYRKAARYCVLFASADYARKLWTNHERQSAQARAFGENREYVLPVRLDDTEIPGVRPTIGYIDGRSTTPEELTELIAAKVGVRQRRKYLPPVPNKLYDRLGVKKSKQRGIVRLRAHRILDALSRTTSVERMVLLELFANACPAGLPANAHISADLLSRHTGLAPNELHRILGGLSSLGIECTKREFGLRDEHALASDDYLIQLSWQLRIVGEEGGNATHVAHAMIDLATEGKCEQHAREAFDRLDFGDLADVTAETHSHAEHDDGNETHLAATGDNEKP